MSKDIRSFFTVTLKKSGSSSKKASTSDDECINATPETNKKSKKKLNNTKNSKPSKQPILTVSSDSEDDKSSKNKYLKQKYELKPSKAPVLLVSSDSEDDKPSRKNDSKRKPDMSVPNKRKICILSSDSEDDSFGKKAKEKFKKNKKEENLKPVDIDSVFGAVPVKQSKVQKVEKQPTESVSPAKRSKAKNSKNETKTSHSKSVHEDKLFDKTILDLDDDDFCNKTIEMLDNLEESIMNASTCEEKEAEKTERKGVSPKKKSLDKKAEKERLQNKRPRSSEGHTSKSKESPKKIKLEHVDSGIDPGQEAYEKKQYSAMLYQKYLNRGGPKHLGMKKLPNGKPDCLKGLCFLRTGVLDSLDAEGFSDIINKHGGRIVHAVSRKVNYVVVGDEPGPAKLAKAQSYGIPEINEDELLNLIREKSGLKIEPVPIYKEDMDDITKTFAEIQNETENNENDSNDVRESKKNKIDAMCDTIFACFKDLEEPTQKFTSRDKKTIEDSNKKRKTDKETKKIKESTSTHKTPKETSSPKKDKSLKRTSETEKETSSFKKDKSPKKTKEHIDRKKSEKEISRTVKSPKKDVDTLSQPGVPKSSRDDFCKSLIEKYKPKDMKQIVGQHIEGSCMKKLHKWLVDWPSNRKRKIQRPSPWAKDNDGAYFKCALLSGPPGIGKTTMATIVSEDLGFDIVEFNASDTRSKKLLQEEITRMMTSSAMTGYMTDAPESKKKRVLLMDEVDGMAGNEDRGGMQELINIIKITKIPIICMCNDRNHQKVRSLASYCFDLKVPKPPPQPLFGFVMSVCCKENIKITPQTARDIISGTQCDVRQILNYLTMLSASQSEEITPDVVKADANNLKKDTILGPWEICRKVFSRQEHKDMSLIDKSRLFFYDYSLGPLFVQENYLGVLPAVKNKKYALKRAFLAADAISMGDLIESKIRGSQNWSLLECQAMYSSVLPGYYMSGEIVKQINFPSWFGKNSNKNKLKRVTSEIHTHINTRITGNRLSITLDYARPLLKRVLKPLISKGSSGIQDAISVMNEYGLAREDIESLSELSTWPKRENLLGQIDAKVKSAFTRTFNQQASIKSGIVKSKKTHAENNESSYGDNAEHSEEEEDDDDPTKDKMIKIKKKPEKKETSKQTAKPKASSSKKKK